MRFKSLVMMTALIWGGSQLAHASQLPLDEATGFNVFVFSNLTGTTDAQGAVAVGGNFTPGSNGFTVGAASAASPDGFALVVGGNFTETWNSVGAGNIYIGGTMNWAGPSITNNAYVAQGFNNSTSGGSVGGTIYWAGSYSSGDTLTNQKESASWIQNQMPLSFSSAQTDLKSLSTSLTGYAANGTVADNYGTYTLTGSNSNLNIFDLTGSTYSGASFTINAPAGSTVIVNVSGTSDSFSNGQINLNGVSINDVIWNFNSATSLSMSSYGFDGTVLAPLADYTGSWGQINGQFIGNSIAGTTQFNEDLFSGNLNSNLGQGGGGATLPEPSTWFLMATACAALILMHARRSRTVAATVTSKR